MHELSRVLRHWQTARFLAEEGASLVAEDNERGQPMHYAAAGGHLAIVCWLVEQGVSFETANALGQKPVRLAKA